MKPIKRRVLNTRYTINIDLSILGVNQVVAKIAGSTKKISQQYSDVRVVLFNKSNLLPIAIQTPKNGEYSFFGLNTGLKTFIVAFDNQEQFNAVIQDNVVPK